jgi:hypothetical protein
MVRTLGAALLVGTLVACASGAPDAAQSPAAATTEGVSVPQGGTCVLHVRYDTDDCSACIQQNCCAETEACFTGNADCAALHTCSAACPADHSNFFIPVGTSDGGAARPTDDGEGHSFGGASAAACTTACEGQHPASTPKHHAYDQCINTKCMPACAGR